MPANMADHNGSGGLYAGFEGYRSPTPEELRRVLTSGIVVPDTNLLLNLYRYTATARDTLLRALEKLETLWVPHQVLTEFWRNRETTDPSVVRFRDSAGVFFGGESVTTEQYFSSSHRFHRDTTQDAGPR
ncbi:PIN-like domain-containing protein [Actinokineospora cianjurensis]|uniref:PIN like domain-containing protein n=1 Tax=Actinokineospora cianjurensis TaxID=585224 RepID=A0A421B8A3_9PSEU|nr:PIN-like domain-containing protein [Actinokineospora cianjurensis]RLK60440.1 hypothetical protein CLV68_0944 [Actinokineospora cianjurensis]